MVSMGSMSDLSQCFAARWAMPPIPRRHKRCVLARGTNRIATTCARIRASVRYFGHRLLKAEFTGSNPVRATKSHTSQRFASDLLRVAPSLHLLAKKRQIRHVTCDRRSKKAWQQCKELIVARSFHKKIEASAPKGNPSLKRQTVFRNAVIFPFRAPRSRDWTRNPSSTLSNSPLTYAPHSSKRMRKSYKALINTHPVRAPGVRCLGHPPQQ